MSGEQCSNPPPPRLLFGITQFNRGEFFEQHETLEDIWREEPAPIRRLYQGILQIGVGFYHLGRNNYRGAINLLQSGINYLLPFQPVCMGVEVTLLIDQARRCRERIIELGPERLAEFDRRLIPQVICKQKPQENTL